MEPWYSIRMHADDPAGRHLSGAERLATAGGLEGLAASLLRRALHHSLGHAERIWLTVEAIDPAAMVTGRLPDLRTVRVGDWRTGREAALEVLAGSGLNRRAVLAAMQALAAGAAAGGDSMRGAMLVDGETGERLEPDRDRGIRVSRMDVSPAAELELRRGLEALGLDNPHVREALVLAGKVLLAPGILGELCWSDDPGYTAGYVAAPALGYVRFPHLKPTGEVRGGRAFFLAPNPDLPALIRYLEQQVVLFDRVGTLRGETPLEG